VLTRSVAPPAQAHTLAGHTRRCGSCLPELLALWQQLRLPDVVAAKLYEPIKTLLSGNLIWTPTELAGTDFAEVQHCTLSRERPRSVIPIRHREDERPQAGGKKLIDALGYVFQALVTSLPTSEPRLAVWRDFPRNRRLPNAAEGRQAATILFAGCLPLEHGSLRSHGGGTARRTPILGRRRL
jgi:hypothetical protein